MNKKELENEIMKTQEQLKKLQADLKEAEEAEKEVPSVLDFNGEKFYHMATTGAIIEEESFDGSDYTDMVCALNHRLFKTRKYAEVFSEKTQFIADMLHFKYLYDRDYEPDLDLEDEQKFCIFYDRDAKRFEWFCRTTSVNFESVYFSSKEIAKKCAVWLNKKYNLEDEK